jgi:oligopeptide transport system substrate-binding protein
MLKKVFLLVTLLLTTLTLSACRAEVYTVTFDSQGGTDVAAVEVEEEMTVAEPTAPTRADAADGSAYSFVTWATDADGANPYDFDAPVTEDLTLYAIWSLEVVLRFETKTTATVESQLLGEDGGDATAPTAPTREGYRFGGWFFGKPGLTWLEPEAVTFPLTVTETTTLYAYWEPLDSKAMSYSEDETYTTSLDSSSSLILNPLTYQWSNEDGLIDMMATPLYTTVVDWEKAIDDGVADFVGDFSKFEDKTYSIEALDFVNILMGAERYPIDSDGDEHLTVDGKYDREGASTFTDTEWTFNIRDDIYFEDGTNITAETFEYSLQMYLDPVLNNFRANSFYKTVDNTVGTPILNAFEYYSGDVTWDQVGFEVLSDYSFKITTWEPISQAGAVAFGNIRLIHEAAYEASLTDNRENSTYGTPASPYVSYGEYILKSWDENQKLVFNKNYEYLGREYINYKSRVIEIVDNIDQQMELFAAGELSATGLNKEYYAQYAEEPNVYKTWIGYPQALMLNTSGGREAAGGDHVVHEILLDPVFRQALFFGFDRQYYATSVYAPNTPALLAVPLDTKAYNQDPLYYSESPQHLAVLEAFDIAPETVGYIPGRAQTLFTQAYNAWIADGNTGPVELKLISNTDEFSVGLVEYIKEMYEELFNTDTETRLLINIVTYDTEALRTETGAWNFDMSLNNIGFGLSRGVHWQMGALPFLGGLLAPHLGLIAPYDASGPDGLSVALDEIVTVDMSNAWAHLNELGYEYLETEELTEHIMLWEYLEESTDPDTGEVKPAGVFQATVYELADYMYSYGGPFNAIAAEPFTGATQDAYNVTAAVETVFLEYVPSIPTVTRSGATIYAENVVITWAAYSSAFQWGADAYRYLNTDSDYEDGLYNSFEAAFLASQE